MNSMKTSDSRGFKTTLIVLLGLAAFSSTIKDVNRVLDVVSGAGDLVAGWQTDGFLASNQKAITVDDGSCPSSAGLSAKSDAFKSDGSDADFVLENSYQEEPEVGARAEVLSRPASRGLLRSTPSKSETNRFFKRETFAKSGQRPWPIDVAVKSFDRDREVTFDYPLNVISDFNLESFNANRLSEMPPNVLGKIGRKQVHIKNESVRRELILRRLDGNISLRRSS